MSVFSKQEAHRQAIQIITAGLSSQAIKLYGTQGMSPSNSLVSSKADTEYLADLIKKLAASLTEAGSAG